MALIKVELWSVLQNLTGLLLLVLTQSCEQNLSQDKRVAKLQETGFVFADSHDLKWSFDKEPYISPKIVQDLLSWISDGGDQVIAINMMESQGYNRYYGKIESSESYVWVEDGQEHGRPVEFGYHYLGKTDNGITVLKTVDRGGGTGVFTNLLLLTFVRDYQLGIDWETGMANVDKERVLLKKVGEISLGDRWVGELKVEGNRIFIGEDVGPQSFLNRDEEGNLMGFSGWIDLNFPE